MAENKLEGFEDFDNLLGDAQAETSEGGGGGDFAGELDDLLGEGATTDDAMAEGEQSDSELDSFFEDLSTIDDLEVLQEDEPAPAAAGDEDAAVPEPDLDEEEVSMPAPAAAPEPRRAKPERKPREKKPPGFIRRWFKRLVILAVLGVVGWFVYNFFFPEGEVPWSSLEEQKDRLVSMVEDKMRAPKEQPPPLPPPETPPPAAMQPKPQPRPEPKPKPRRVVQPKPAPERGPWSIQVATCFFPSCLETFRSYLQANGRSVIVKDKVTRTESLEIYSISSWRERDEARGYAERINRENPLEGHAFVYQEDGGYRISMGAFSDLARANVVKDALSQQYRGQVAFATRVKAFPYKLQTVMTGRFPNRAAAQSALEKLKDAEPRFKDAFVARNR